MDRLVARGLSCLAVLDVSASALQRARARLGSKHNAVRWIEADVTADWRIDPVDIWHDRAAFHFLTDRDDRRRYVARLVETVKPLGHVIIATFSMDGPSKCSGLDVVRYSPGSLAEELGDRFTLIHTVEHRHTTPTGAVQPFTYAVFQITPTHPQ